MTRSLLFPSYSVRTLIACNVPFDKIVERLEIEPQHYDRVKHLIKLHHDRDEHRRNTRLKGNRNHVHFR